MIGIVSIAVPAVISLLVAVLMLYFEYRNAKKEMKYSRLLKAYELGLKLFVPTPKGFSAMAEQQYACDLVRLNPLVRAYCSKELASHIDNFVQQYLRSYKIMACNLLITEDAWHSTDLFENSNGNPARAERYSLEERGGQKCKRKIQRIQFEFAENMSKLVKE